MKKTLLTLVIATAMPFTYADEKANTASMTQSLLDNIIVRDVAAAQSAIASLKTAIAENTKVEQRSADVDNAFAKVVATWKAVQAAYIVGEVDSDMIDTPRLMDTYHEGNEDLNEQIERAIKSGDEPRIALFKNTFKSINALAILLYADNQLNATERTYADYVLTTLNKHLSDIKTAYEKHTAVLNKDQDKSMSYVLNALIDSSFKLKEWRIGEAAGLAKKYSGKPDNRRQEYAKSGNSLNAAAAIIGVHDDMMSERDYVNLGSSAIKQGAEKEVAGIRELIDTAKKQLAELEKEKVTDFSEPRIKTLYKTLSDLNDAYYQSLVKALPVQAKILDADGD